MFALCFGQREAMIVLSGFELVSAAFWVAVAKITVPGWPDGAFFDLFIVCLLVANAVLGVAATLCSSERLALVLIATFSLQLGCLAIEGLGTHPSACEDNRVVDDSALGAIVTRLLWTSDACMLMTILGWASLGAMAGTACYLWYTIVCLWRELHARSDDLRRVRRAIAALPVRKYRAAAAADGGEAGEGDSCAICLGDFDEGEEVRLLPCMHEFCRACIDPWIERQGLAASCPLCKRRLVQRRAGRNEQADEAEDDGEEGEEGAEGEADASLRPLVASGLPPAAATAGAAAAAAAASAAAAAAAALAPARELAAPSAQPEPFSEPLSEPLAPLCEPCAGEVAARGADAEGEGDAAAVAAATGSASASGSATALAGDADGEPRSSDSGESDSASV